MSASNAIGQGAVILTANADALLDGLKGAEEKTTSWAKRLQYRASNFLTQNPISKALFGLPEFDAKSGAYLGRVGGLLGKIKGLFKGAGAAGGGGKGGLIGGALFGNGALAAGGPAGAALAAVGVAISALTKGVDFITGLPETAKSIREAMGQIRLRPGQLAPPTDKLDSVIESFERIQSVGTQIGAKILGAFAPALQRAADLVDALFVRLEPMIDSIGERFGSLGSTAAGVLGNVLNVAATLFEAVWPILDRIMKVIDVLAFIGGEVFGEITDLISDIIKGVADWISSLIDLSGISETTSQVVFKAARYIGYGFAYAWDALKAGAGAMAYVGAYILDGLSEIVSSFKDTIKDLLGLAGKLPDELGGAKFREMINSVDEWPSKLDATSAKMKAWGKGTFDNFGNSTKDIDKWFDKIEQKFGKQGEFRAPTPREIKLTGAATRNSAEAESILTKFTAANIVTGQPTDTNSPIKIAKDQLNATRDVKRLMSKLVERTERTIPVEILP